MRPGFCAITGRLLLTAAVMVSSLKLAFSAPDTKAPIVVGQSLPLTGAGFTAANRIMAGTRAAVEATNRAGGIGGRRIKLVTLDDANDPSKHMDNLTRLATESQAVAFLSCLGERSCESGSTAAKRLGVPLVGPIAGSPRLRESEFVFAIRPDVDREALSLAKQIRQLGYKRAMILVENDASERSLSLDRAMKAQGVNVTLRRIDVGGLASALRDSSRFPVLIIELGIEATEGFGQLSVTELGQAPLMLASLSSPSLTTLVRLFHGHVIGFTAVVPHPEVPSSMLIRDLERDASQYAAEAVSYEGLEAYLSALVCIEAIRRSGATISGSTVVRALARLGRIEVGEFGLDVGRKGQSASQWIEVVLRSRNGVILR